MTTGTEIITELNTLFSDDAHGRFSAAQKLAAVNRAIGSAWPDVWVPAFDSTITLSGSTYAYTPSATPEGGFRVAYVSNSLSPLVLLRGVKQRQTAANTFEIMLDAETAGTYTSETLYLQYVARCPRLSAAGTTISAALSFDYLLAAAAAALCLMAPVKAAQFDVDQYQGLYAGYKREAEMEKANLARGLKPLPAMIDFVAEHGRGAELLPRHA